MAKKSISQSIRFPPFDSSNWIAEALPITKKEIESTDYAPNFTIETDDGWLIEQSSSDKKEFTKVISLKWFMVEELDGTLCQTIFIKEQEISYDTLLQFSLFHCSIWLSHH